MSSRAPAGGSRLGADAWAMLGLALGLLVWFGGLFALRGYRFPVGPDAPVYLWWTRLAGLDGLSRVERPGAIALLEVLRWTGVGLPAAVAGAECALGVAVGLGSAALARAAGASRSGWLVAGALAGTFATHLASGYVSNLAFAVVFLGAIVALGGADRRSVVAAALLLGAGALAHPPFFAVGVGVLVLAGALAYGSDRAEATRAVLACGGGGAVLGIGLLTLLGGPPVLRVDTSQDAFLRRAGLTGSLAHAYRDRLIHRWTRYVEFVSLPLAMAGAGRPTGWPRRALWAWVAVTVLGVAGGAATGWFPPDRFITFCYAIPILAAFGLVVLVERWRAPHAMVLGVAGALTVAMLAGSGMAWLREKPYLGTPAVDDVTLAARWASASDAGTPWIFPVDSPSDTVSFLATRLANVIRASVPPDRIEDVYVVVPPPPGGLDVAHRREWSALARLYASDADAAVSRSNGAAVVIDIDAFRPRGADRTPVCVAPLCNALAAPTTRVGDGVAVSAAVVASAGGSTAPDTTLDSSTGRVLVAAPLVLAVLFVAGLGWGLASVEDAVIAVVLAPAFGAAAIELFAIAADRLGLRLSRPGAGWLVLGLAAIAGYGLLFERRRRSDATP